MVNNQWSLVIFLVRRGAPFRELLRGSEREIELNELPLILQHSYQIDRHNEFRGLGSKTLPFLQESDNLRSTSCQFLAIPEEEGESSRRTPCSDRKSTRLNSSHTVISYAVFCLKKKKRQ